MDKQRGKKIWVVRAVGVEDNPRHKSYPIEFYNTKKDAKSRRNKIACACLEGFGALTGIKLAEGEIKLIRLTED